MRCALSLPRRGVRASLIAPNFLGPLPKRSLLPLEFLSFSLSRLHLHASQGGGARIIMDLPRLVSWLASLLPSLRIPILPPPWHACLQQNLACAVGGRRPGKDLRQSHVSDIFLRSQKFHLKAETCLFNLPCRHSLTWMS